MKLVRLVLISTVLFTLAASPIFAQAAPPAPAKPLSPEELAKREQLKKDCNALLDRFAANKWVNETTNETGVLKAELSFERVLNNQFLSGSLAVRDSSGKITFESRLMLTFNWGVGQYLVYSFESDGWSRMFLGEPNAEQMMVQGVIPGGVEHYRWKITPEGNLERAFWKASKEMKIADIPPDEVIVFTPVKPPEKK